MGGNLGVRGWLKLWIAVESVTAFLLIAAGIAMFSGGITEVEASGLHRAKHFALGVLAVVLGLLDGLQVLRMKRDLEHYDVLHPKYLSKRQQLVRSGIGEAVTGCFMLLLAADVQFGLLVNWSESSISQETRTAIVAIDLLLAVVDFAQAALIWRKVRAYDKEHGRTAA